MGDAKRRRLDTGQGAPVDLTGSGAAPKALKQSSLLAFASRRPATPQVVDPAEVAEFRSAWLPKIGSWCDALLPVLRTPSVQKTIQQVEEMRKVNQIFPPPDDVFKAFLATPFEKVRIVIVGQDPYHGLGQANGLAFSVAPRVAIPPSLINMLKEAAAWPASHGDLTSWAQQGVLLLNLGGEFSHEFLVF